MIEQKVIIDLKNDMGGVGTTQLCGGGTTKSNSNELPISVPLSKCISYCSTA